MNEFIKGKDEIGYFVESPDHLWKVYLKDASESHQFALALLLQKIPTPSIDPRYYRLYEGMTSYRPLNKDWYNCDDWSLEGCCSSGCPDCPFT